MLFRVVYFIEWARKRKMDFFNKVYYSDYLRIGFAVTENHIWLKKSMVKRGRPFGTLVNYIFTTNKRIDSGNPMDM